MPIPKAKMQVNITQGSQAISVSNRVYLRTSLFFRSVVLKWLIISSFLGCEYRRMLTCVSSKTRSHDVVGISGEAEKKTTGLLSINERIIEAKKTILAACEKRRMFSFPFRP
jgi:hypothetical protein